MIMNKVIAIVGPTASGKTKMAIEMGIRKATIRNIMTIVIETVLAIEMIYFEPMNCKYLSSIWVLSISKHSAPSSLVT